MADPVLCPECGWSGTRPDLDVEGEERVCPACNETVEVEE